MFASNDKNVKSPGIEHEPNRPIASAPPGIRMALHGPLFAYTLQACNRAFSSPYRARRRALSPLSLVTTTGGPSLPPYVRCPGLRALRRRRVPQGTPPIAWSSLPAVRNRAPEP
jgi:hypothetical protein